MVVSSGNYLAMNLNRNLAIAIYLPDLSGGGAEKLQINLAQYFLAEGHKVEFVLDRAEGALLPAVPSGASVVGLGSRRVLQSLPRLARYLRQNKPDILLANLNHNNLIALWAGAVARTGTKIIVCQHSVLSGETIRLGGKHRFVPFLYRLFLPWADAVVAVSRGMAGDMAALTKFPLRKITVIYNGVVTTDFDVKAAMPVVHPWFGDPANDIPVFVAVGRLVEQKDFPCLLRGLAKVIAHRPARLIILGEGPLRPELTELAARLGIAQSVELAGYHSNPLPFMRKADGVVLSSLYEGFAIVLAEALACGTRVVSTDCPEGPAEILENGVYGDLVPVGDPAALAEAMMRCLQTPRDAAKLRQRGRDFSVAACGHTYLELFRRVLD